MNIRHHFFYSVSILLLLNLIAPVSVLAIEQKIDLKRLANESLQGNEALGHKLERPANESLQGNEALGHKLERPANESLQGNEALGHKLERPANKSPKGNVTIGHKLEVTPEYLEQLAYSKKVYPARLTSKESLILKHIIQDINANNNGAANNKWGQLISRMTERNRPDNIDVNSLIQYVLREAYVEATEDLRYAQYKITFYHNIKKQIRQNIDEARDKQSKFMSENKAGGSTGKAQKSIVVKTIRNIPTPSPNKKYFPKIKTKFQKFDNPDEIEDLIEKWEEELQSVGDDAQLEDVDLQNQLENQQQTMQMMSNISKALHDTAMAIIKKIGK